MNARIVTVAVAAIAVVGIAAFFVQRAMFSDSGDSEEATSHYSGTAISFDYPASWERRSYQKQSSFSSAIVFMSTGRLREPCATTTDSGTVTSISCGWAVERLADSGVYVEWSANGFPGWQLTAQGGEPRTIGGREARVQEDAPGACTKVGGDVTVTALIARGPDNWYEMEACLKGPHLDESRRQVNDMLSSLEINKS